MARALLHQRSMREDLLSGLSTLADPCWHILLQLFCADHAEKRSVVSVAKLLNVSIPTAERYFRLLEEHAFIRISLNEGVMTALLQPSALRAMNEALEDICQSSRELIC